MCFPPLRVAPQNRQPGALLRPSPYPIHTAGVVPIQELPVFPLQRSHGLLLPAAASLGTRCPTPRPADSWGQPRGAGTSQRWDTALPDIMGTPVPAPASVRAGFQRGVRPAPVAGHQPGQSAAQLILTTRAAGTREAWRGRECDPVTEQLVGK